MVYQKNARITAPMMAHKVELIRAEVFTPRRFSAVNNKAKMIGHNRPGYGIWYRVPLNRSAIALEHQMVQINGLSM